jgi:hypothetical protein
MRTEMSKMMSRAFTIAGVAAVLTLAPTAGPAVAAVGNVGLTQALVDSDDLVLVQQQRKKGKGKRSSTPKISPEHQQRIRQHVPAEYHQYIPGMGGGGGAGAGGAGAGAGAAGGIPR